jgi:cytochrome b561
LCIFITGYLITTAEGKPATIFDVINIPALTELQADQVDLVGEIHEYAAWIIIILAALHAAGALLHHFVYRDQTLMRIFKVAKKKM